MSIVGRFSRVLVVGVSLFGASCEKEETPVTLPAPTGASRGEATLGQDYHTQIFWDFEANKEVYRSEVASWDLCFEASAAGYHVWMNGGKGVNLYNTHSQNFAGVHSLPAGFKEADWGWDDPSGQVTATAVGDWCDPKTRKSKGDVFIVRLAQSATTYYKFQLTGVTDDAYTLVASALTDDGPGTPVTLQKDSAYSRVYFAFTGTAQPRPAPPRAAWDVVFTRYRHIYYDLDNTPYIITGVLLNPFNTTAAQDSTLAFAAATPESADPLTFSNDQNVIGGFGWKTYNFNTGRYTVDQNRTYFIRNRNRRLYKLHFLDFYKDGVKGSPSFESQRLQ